MTTNLRQPAVTLVAAALAAWAGAGAGLAAGASGHVAAGWVSLAASASLAAIVRVRWPRFWAVVLSILLVAMAAAAVALVRISPLVSGPLPEAATERAFVTAVVQLTGDPVTRSGQVRGTGRSDDGVSAAAAVVSWTRASVTRTEAIGVRVLWTGEPRQAVPGTVLEVSGRLAPGLPLARNAATLIAETVRVVAGPPVSQQAAAVVRESLRRSGSSVGGDAGALLPGLVLGDTSAVSPDLAQAMRDAGLSHLTAVSGGNVAVTLAMIWWVARRCGVRRRGLIALAAVTLPAYVLLVRPDPSVLRAAVMAGIGLVALAGGLRARGLPTLALTTVVLLLLDPFLAQSIGFALSVAATGGLIVTGQRWSRGGGRWSTLVAAPIAATLATAPLIAGIGGGLSLLSVPANILAAPAVAPAGVLGLLAALVGVAAPLPGQWLTAAAAAPAWWIATVARHAADVPGSVLPWPHGWAGALTLAAVLALALAGFWAARQSPYGRPALAVVTVVVVLVALAPATGLPVPGKSWPVSGWVLVACDIGQGDGLVLAAGDGAAVVVDTGPDPQAMDRCLTRLGVHNVPVVLLSHEHADHVEGLPGVLRGRQVGQIVVSPLAEPASETSRVHRWADAAGVPVVTATAGEERVVGPLRWTVLWPDRLLRDTDSDPNNASLVLLVVSHGLRILLGGDVQPEAQQVFLRDHPPGPVDVVKVPHHGSRKQDPSYAVDTHPRIALISCGVDNDYGHPAPGTVRQYEAAGAVVGRTDRDGDLAITVDPTGTPTLIARGKTQ